MNFLALKMINKKILILVCAYNEQEGIYDCLESIKLSIELHGLEDVFSVVCVDNSSTDNTPGIASKFAIENKGFSYVKIKHCNLCVSRNTYKYFNGYDYVAYIDGDGYVSESWAINLNRLIESNSKACMISGPVLNLESEGENLVWEMYFDSELYGSDCYLIGANMVFSRSILNKVDGFPSFFPVRGDESSLLIRINSLNEEVTHVFDKGLIAYNYFPSDLTRFLRMQYSDGKRSYDISQLNGAYLKTSLNAVIKIFSLFFLMFSIVCLFIQPTLSLLSFFMSIAPFFIRHKKYIRNVFKRINKLNFFRRLRFCSIIILSRYLFDVGFLVSFFGPYNVRKEMLDKTENPVILEKIDGQ